MRFIHIADTHLGAEPDGGKAYSNVRARELWDSFSNVLDACEEQKIELLLIAGDMFHRQPLLRELKEVNYLFSKLTTTRIVLIAGNHDYIRPDSYYADFRWNDNVHMLRGKEMEAVEFSDLELCVYGFSYYKREIFEARYDEPVRKKSRQKHSILLAHGGDEKHIPVKKNKVLQQQYDYVALGHIHKPMDLEANIMRYAGALEPIDKNDTGVHGYIFGEITDRGVRTTFVKCAKREYIHLDVAVSDQMTSGAVKEQIKDTIKQQGIENLYKIELQGFRDPDIIFDVSNMDTYGNILEIVDATSPSYNFEKLLNQNLDNLLGKYILSLRGSEIGSVEYLALHEGVQAILDTKRG